MLVKAQSKVLNSQIENQPRYLEYIESELPALFGKEAAKHLQVISGRDADITTVSIRGHVYDDSTINKVFSLINSLGVYATPAQDIIIKEIAAELTK